MSRLTQFICVILIEKQEMKQVCSYNTASTSYYCIGLAKISFGFFHTVLQAEQTFWPAQ